MQIKMPFRGSKGVVVRLKGRQFAEPPKPRQLNSWKLKREDRRANHRPDEQEFVDTRIDAEAGELIAQTEIDYGKPVGAAERVGADAAAQREDALREVGERDEEEEGMAAREDELGERPSPRRLVVFATKALLFLISLPIDVEAAHALPLAQGMQTILAITIGAGMVVAADWAGKKLEDLHQAHLARERDIFEFWLQLVLLAVAIGVPLFVVIGTTLMRSQAFTSEERLTGGLVQGGAANMAFAALTLMAFTVALLMSLAHRRALPLREVRAARKKNRAERTYWRGVADAAERVEQQASLTVASLEAGCERRIRGIEQWGERRKATTRLAAAKNSASAHRRGALGGSGGIGARPGAQGAGDVRFTQATGSSTSLRAVRRVGGER
jgi:hypothetical protein